ncbi:MAG: glycosyltransferase, partial [Gaiellales bacterium]
MRASVVIPVRDRVVLTAQTLDWLQAGLGETDLVEIVVVDDGSTDATVDLMKARAPRATVVRHDESRGFAAACNAGAAVAAGDVVVFLNNDLTPIEG